MNRTVFWRRLEVLAFVLVFAAKWNLTAAQDAGGPRLKEASMEILRWLPVDVETIIVAKGPLQIPVDIPGKPTFKSSLELLPLQLFSRVHEGAVASELKGCRIQIAVEGSRHFRAPNGIGMMPYEGCQILRVDGSDDGTLQHIMATCFERAFTTTRIAGTKVAVFRETWGADEWSLFLVRPRRGILLAATERRFLEEVLVRMNRDHRDRALPNALPEWDHVNTDASVWAIRHYRNDFAESDPSSPLRARGGANVPDPKAVGFTFWYDGKTARARYLTGSGNAAQIVAKGWNRSSQRLSPLIKTIEIGVVEISIPISGTSTKGNGRMFLFALLGYLGHAVYL